MSPTHSEINLLGQSADELRALAKSMGEPAYRGAQLYHALYAEKRVDFAAMSNLPAAFRERLSRETRLALPKIARQYPAADGTIRKLFAESIERNSIHGSDAPETAAEELKYFFTTQQLQQL